jgi:hypothetical protein
LYKKVYFCLTCMLTHMALQKFTTMKVMVTSHCCCVKLDPKQAIMNQYLYYKLITKTTQLSHCCKEEVLTLCSCYMSNLFS